MYTGVVFDFDGVLYDSEKHWYEIENRYLITRISTWDPHDHKNLLGLPLQDSYKYLRSRGLNLTDEEYFADYHSMAVQLYSNSAKPLKNVDTLLHELAKLKMKIAIASSSKLAWINIALQSNKLPVVITVIVSGDDTFVTKGKPAPEVYLRAAQLLNEPTSKLIAIEDSKNGVTSAKAAGLYCIGLRNGFNNDQDLSEADDIISGYSQESVAKIMKLIV